MTDDPSDEEAKELYAHFGLTFYCSNVLEHGVANALLVLGLLNGWGGAETKKQWETLVDNHYESSFSQTLGKLIDQLKRYTEQFSNVPDILSDLHRCVKERNFLTHHFWREFALHWYTHDGRRAMFNRLEEIRELFLQTDRKLDATI